MAKIKLSTIASTTDVSSINANFKKLETELNDKVLYRNNPVKEVNTLVTGIDANGQAIYNLPAPVLAHQAARLGDIQQVLSMTEDAAEAAVGALAASEVATVAAGTAVKAANQALGAVADVVTDLSNTVKKGDLGSASGTDYVGSMASPVSVPYLQTLSQILRAEPVSLFRFIDPDKHSAIRDFTSTLDVSSDIQAAFQSGAKRLQADYGLYNLDTTAILTNALMLEGAGIGTIFNQRAITLKASFYHNSGSPTILTNGFQFRDFVIQCANGTFSEQQHLIELSGVRNCLIEAVRFHGFRGDGLYIGSGAAGEERHNVNIQVRKSVFDGINNENRNGISVIDVDGMSIEDSLFFRCTRPNMPGPIDFEPDGAAFHVIKNVGVRRNRFRSNGGNVSEVSVYVPAAVTAPPSNITVESNDSEGYVGTGSFFSHNSNRLPTDARVESSLTIAKNRAVNGNRPYVLADVKGARISENLWDTMKREALLGYTDSTNGLRDVSIDKDKYLKVGTVGGIGISVFSVSRLKMRDVQMEDCGVGSGGSYAIDFNTGTSSYVEIDGLSVTSPTGKTLVGIQKEVAHTFAPNTNKYYRSNLNGLSNAFQSHESDTIETSYLPVVGGSTTTGTGSYTSQLGMAKRIGTKAFVRLNIVCDANHITNNTGIIQISLPWPCKQGGTMDTHIPITVIGVTAATSSGQYGRLVQALSVGGVLGAIRTYYNSGGTQANVVVPNGPFTILANFSYEVAEGY